MPKYRSEVRARLDEDLFAALKAEAARRGCAVADLVRDLLREGLSERAALDGRAAMDAAIRRAIKPAEERLAALAAKAAMDAGTAMLLLQELCRRWKIDEAVYQSARKKAVARLRQPEAPAAEPS